MINPFRLFRSIYSRLFNKPLESFPDAPDLFHSYRYLVNHSDVERKPGGWVYKDGFYPDYLFAGGASHAIFDEASNFCKGYGVDIGAGLWPITGSIPVDIWRGPGKGKHISDFKDRSLDYVFSSHCLEHIDNWQEALKEWQKKIKKGGVIFLYLPHPDCAIWHPGSPFVGDGHKWSPTIEIIRNFFIEQGYKIIKENEGPDFMQSFYVCATQNKCPNNYHKNQNRRMF